jgi:hypothetical protein
MRIFQTTSSIGQVISHSIHPFRRISRHHHTASKMSSAFSIQPCTPADLPVLTDIWRDSFANDPFLLARWPESQVDPATLYAYVKNAFSKYLETPHTQSWKVVDTSTGAIAGWTHWGMPHTPTEEEKEKERLEKEKEQREKEEGKSKFPAGSNIEICEWKSAGWERMREKWYRKEDMFCESHVFFSPSSSFVLGH